MNIIPLLEDLIVDLNGVKFFSKLDINERYRKFELHPELISYITTFSTHRATKD